MSMDINSYVNSPDIRNHWEKIKYNPTALEAAWLVWQDKNHTLAETLNVSKHTSKFLIFISFNF